MKARFVWGSSPPTGFMRWTLLLFVLFGALLLAPTAALASGNDVIQDCADNARIDGDHGPQDYADALSNLPSDLDEYTDCRQIISQARSNPPQPSGGGGGGGDGVDGGGGNGGGRGGSGGSGGSSPKASDSGQVAGAQARKAAAPKGPPEVPPTSTLASKPVQRGIPISLLLVIGLLVLGAVAALVGGLMRRRRRRLQPGPEAAPDAPTDTQPDRLGHRVFPRRA